MANLNLYIRDSDEKTLERFKKMLEEEGRSVSEFVVGKMAEFVEEKTAEKKAADPEEIVLQGIGPKRIFKGKTLYREEYGNGTETGVFLTARGSIAFFNVAAEGEVFKVYDSLDELFDDQGWNDDERVDHIRQEIQETYIALTGEEIIERLDI